MIRAVVAFLFLTLLSAISVDARPLQPRSNGGCAPASVLPLDTGVSGISRAYGTCALTKNWLNRKFADVVVNDVTYTINFINGAPDTRRLAQLMGNINPQFGTGGLPLARWYDQTGSGDDCIQTTAANQMSVWLINGQVSISADGYFVNYISGGTPQDRYCSASSVTTNSQASTYYFAGRPFQFGAPGYNNSSGASVLIQPGSGCCGGGAGSGFQIGAEGDNNGTAWNPSNFFTFSWDGFSGPTNTQLWPEDQPVVIGTILGSSTVTWTQNEETPTTCGASCALTAQTSTGITIGSNNATFTGQGAYVGFQGLLVFGTTALSTGNQQTIRNSLYARFGIPSTQSYSVIVDGASYDIHQGGLIGGVNGYGWSEQMRSRIPYPVRFVNIATSGATVANLITDWTNMTSFPCTGSFSKVVYIGPNSAVGNSIAGGETGAQAFTDTSNLLTLVKSKCPSITNVIVATLPGGGEFANYNALVRSNASSLGYTVADWSADIVMGDFQPSSNPILYNQTGFYAGHPTIQGYSFFANDTIGPLRAAIGK